MTKDEEETRALVAELTDGLSTATAACSYTFNVWAGRQIAACASVA